MRASPLTCLAAASLAAALSACADGPPGIIPTGFADAGGTTGLVELRQPCCGKVETTPVACTATTNAGAFTFDKVATWRDDAKAAYSMIHDDVCGPALRGIDQYAVPALALRNLSAGLGPFVQVCEQGNLWKVVQDAENLGNEIVNHSYTHPNITVANAPLEVVMSKAQFDMRLRNPVTFYIFPFDFWTPDTVKAVENAGHFGARTGSRDDNDGFTNPPINPPDPGNDMALEFDVWPRTYSKYALFPGNEILNLHVWNAVDRGAYSVREMHSVSGQDNPSSSGSEGFGPVPLRTYEDHLDFLVKAWKANLVWTANPSTVIRYRHARTACSASVTGSNIIFDTTNPDCVKYATPISVIVHTANDVPGLKATQGASPVFTRKLGPNTFSVDADPTVGSVALDGCVTPSSTVDPTVDLPGRPSPAQSVCELERVVGTGEQGSMDNLDRRNEQLRILPNPAQGDGRTGSWSWYPVSATSAGIVREGMNGYLRFTGANIGVFAGVTLAFLGGNGAGSCYDASAYKGVRFKIRGTVASTDSLAGAVIVSVVTAETQSQNYGGDLKGQGGHFHKIIDVTDQWQTVSIPWTDFAAPTFGDSLGLTRLAIEKLQALDWGIGSAATRFDVALDDISLY
jgi:hypothetical protein